MASSDYYRQWRADHPEYRAREVARATKNKLVHGRGDRTKEYARRPSRAVAPVPPLFPELHHGARLEFWDEALASDLRQEAALAQLEGRDPIEAVREYRAREHAWWRWTVPLWPARTAQEPR